MSSTVYTHLFQILKKLAHAGLRPRYFILIHYIIYLVRQGRLDSEEIEPSIQKFMVDYSNKLSRALITKT